MNNSEQTGEKKRPDTFNIPKRTELALKNIFEMADPAHDYVTYIGSSLCEDPPHFVHHRLGWTEALPYSVHGAVSARKITGNKESFDIQAAQRNLMLKHINPGDGLIYAPESPWNDSYPLDIWEQARTIYALIYCFLDTEDEEYLDLASGIAAGLFKLSGEEGKKRFFDSRILENCSMGLYGNGAVIDPLLKLFELNNDMKAFRLAEGLFYNMVEPSSGYFNEEGRFGGFFRSAVSCISGFTRFSLHLDNPRYIKKAKQIHDYALSRCTSFGSTPCNEPVCSDYELNVSAFALASSGDIEYWEQIDRFVRNQIAEAQFLDPAEWVREKAGKKRINRFDIYNGYPDDLQILPWDDYNNIVNRSVGGFMWCTANEHMYFPASLMICCTSHAIRSFELIWENAVRKQDNLTTVNFYYNMENANAEIISYEPYEGKITVIPKTNTTLKLRIPEYVPKETLRIVSNGASVNFELKDNYALIENVTADTELSLLYPLNIYKTNETQYIYEYPDYDNLSGKEEYEVIWKGNTVVKLNPESTEEKGLYKREFMCKKEAPFIKTDYYISNGKKYYE